MSDLALDALKVLVGVTLGWLVSLVVRSTIRLGHAIDRANHPRQED